MNGISSHTIFSAIEEDGTFLAFSIDSSRFCVGGATEREAFEKAGGALEDYHGLKDVLARKRAGILSAFWYDWDDTWPAVVARTSQEGVVAVCFWPSWPSES